MMFVASGRALAGSRTKFPFVRRLSEPNPLVATRRHFNDVWDIFEHYFDQRRLSNDDSLQRSTLIYEPYSSSHGV